VTAEVQSALGKSGRLRHAVARQDIARHAQPAINMKCHYFPLYSPGTVMHSSHLGTFHNNEEVEMVVRERPRMRGPDFYRDDIFTHVPSWDECLNVIGREGGVYLRRIMPSNLRPVWPGCTFRNRLLEKKLIYTKCVLILSMASICNFFPSRNNWRPCCRECT
jgi:hypothetical protein